MGRPRFFMPYQPNGRNTLHTTYFTLLSNRRETNVLIKMEGAHRTPQATHNTFVGIPIYY